MLQQFEGQIRPDDEGKYGIAQLLKSLLQQQKEDSYLFSLFFVSSQK